MSGVAEIAFKRLVTCKQASHNDTIQQHTLRQRMLVNAVYLSDEIMSITMLLTTDAFSVAMNVSIFVTRLFLTPPFFFILSNRYVEPGRVFPSGVAGGNEESIFYVMHLLR
jgi:hypothetical protein